MKRGAFWMLAMLLAASCSDDKSTVCGSGDPVTIDQTTYCVFEQAVVVENGFECPPDAPFLTPGMGFSVCGASEPIPLDLLDLIEQEWKNEYETCTLDTECADGDSCIVNHCSTPEIQNNTHSSTNNTQNAACQSDTECAVGQICSVGVCIAEEVCGGFLGTQCATTQYCDYGGPTHMCGAADQTGVCRTRPDVCDQSLSPVCGCDGSTYNNLCTANANGFDIMSEGQCR